MTSSEYICELNKASEIKALEELHEDPKDRLEAVAVLRTWVEQQQHLKAPTGKHNSTYNNIRGTCLKRTPLRNETILANMLG